MRNATPLLFCFFTACLGSSRPIGTLDTPEGRPETTRIHVTGTAAGAYETTTSSTKDATSHAVRLPIDKAWPAVAWAYTELQLPGSVLDARNRVFGMENWRMGRSLAGKRPSHYINCGSGPGGEHADNYDVSLSIKTTVVAEGTVSHVQSLVEGTAKPMMTSGSMVRCVSTGRLEPIIAEAVLRQASIQGR